MSDAVFARVYEVLARVPAGRVVTYGQIAMAIGMPRGARTVGWALRQCPPGLPWHRVVTAKPSTWLDEPKPLPNARGAISGGSHTQRAALQRSLLEDEGVAFDEKGCIDLRTYGWDEI